MEAYHRGVITELESKVLDYILDEYVHYDGSGSEFRRTSVDTNISTKQLKGVVGSLVKKDFIWTEDYTSGGITDQWIHATEKGLAIVGLKCEDFL